MIALSFAQASTIIIPFSHLVSGQGVVSIFALVLIYFIIFTSWIGHYRSTRHWPYSTAKTGITRFIVSLSLLYLYYQSVNLLAGVNRQHYDDTLLYVLPAIFSGYVVYDVLKYLEYRNTAKRERKDIGYRLIITAVFFGSFLGLSAFYYHLAIVGSIIPLETGSIIVLRPLFIAIAVVLVIVYRYKKWHIKGKKRFDEEK